MNMKLIVTISMLIIFVIIFSVLALANVFGPHPSIDGVKTLTQLKLGEAVELTANQTTELLFWFNTVNDSKFNLFFIAITLLIITTISLTMNMVLLFNRTRHN
ncbi:MAG: hypothetical protein HRU38_25230 [Saccharospirillaceae bacterium]|nr:hypothetical protein [Saccharospirillaceae bacterium]